MRPLLIDRRQVRGSIWNADELRSRFGLVTKPASRGDAWVDKFIAEGYARAGQKFLRAIEGRFGCVFRDEAHKRLVIARDWIGEVPLHWIATPRAFIVANTVSALREAAGSNYDYRYVRAFPQSKALEIDLSGVISDCVSESARYSKDVLYYDFAEDVRARIAEKSPLSSVLKDLREDLQAAIARRLRAWGSRPIALLLSGGLDSLSIGLVLRSLGARFTAYTLSVGEGGDDVSTAVEFAGHLGVEHRVVRVTEREIVRAAPRVVRTAETYQLYNFFCSVGMDLLGQALAKDGICAAFCGEAVNEALGDYHDWTVNDPRKARPVVLQRVNFDRMSQSSERLLYVWGQSRDRGKYNHQLGTGLAKHAGSRMTKPFLHHGISLECPYYDRRILSGLIAIRGNQIERAGGKPGLFLTSFSRDIKSAGISREEVLSCRKVRFQDASEGGRGGLTPVLLAHGWTQPRLLKEFNVEFGSHLAPDLESQRLSTVTA